MGQFYEKYRTAIKNAALAVACFIAIFITVQLTSGNISNAMLVTFIFLMIVVVSAFWGNFYSAVAVSTVAALCFNYFYLPPVGTFTIYSATDWVAFFVFLLTAIAISRLTASSARIKTRNAALEMTLNQLHKFGSWLLERPDAQLTLTDVAKETLAMFNLQYCSIHVYSEGKWSHYFGSASTIFTKEIENLINKQDRKMDLSELSDEQTLGVRYFQIKKAERIFAVLAVKDDTLPAESFNAIAYLIGLRLSNALA